MSQSKVLMVAAAALVIGLLQGMTAARATVVLDFNSQLAPHSPVNLTESGFSVVGQGANDFDTTVIHGGSADCSPDCAYNGTKYLFAWLGGSFVLQKSGGGTFSFSGFDGAEGQVGNPTSWAQQIQITGQYQSGGTVTEAFTLDGIQDGLGPLNDFQTFVATQNFSGLTSLQISGIGHSDPGSNWFSVDNIVLDAPPGNLPAPNALALLGLGFAGLAFGRRKAGSAPTAAF